MTYRVLKTGALCAAVALTVSGCDIFGSSGPLKAPSSADIADLEELLNDQEICTDNDVSIETLSESESGTLDADSDCLSDDAPLDFYAFELEEDASVDLDLESDDFPPGIILASVDLDDEDEPLTLVDGDENDSEDDTASISGNLDAGLYFVFLGSVSDTDQEGDYTITTDAESDDSGDDDDRPARVVLSGRLPIPASLR